MILSDTDLVKELGSGLLVHPLAEGSIQPASIDLRLGSDFAWWPEGPALVDLDKGPDAIPPMKELNAHEFILSPGQFVLATTYETVQIGPDLVARVEGRSSLGRLGLVVHATAGFIDPGFRGQITLELTNISPHHIRLVAGLGICQLAIERLQTRCTLPYGHPNRRSKYQGQLGVQGSRWAGRGTG
jgi:dCTP deaminase